MRTHSKLIRKAALTITLGLSLLAGGLSISSFAPSATIIRTDYCGVSQDEITEYMNSRGYDVYSIRTYNNCDVIVDTQNEWHTLVFIEDGIITGHEDLPH